MIDQRTKEQIKNELNKRVAHIGSAKKAEVELKISNATISNILNATAQISDKMWYRMASVLGVRLDDVWNHANTKPYEKLTQYFTDAREHANVFALTTNPGGGKTHALDHTLSLYNNQYYTKCHRHTTERDLLENILVSMRVTFRSHRITEMLNKLVKTIHGIEKPSIIIDEFEKVKPEVFLLSIDIYNVSEGDCGLNFIGTKNLKNRLDRGVASEKLGYNEFVSRIGGKVIEIPAPDHDDAINVIKAQGISEADSMIFKGNRVGVIDHIIAESDNEFNEVDLRRVKRLVHAYKQKEASK